MPDQVQCCGLKYFIQLTFENTKYIGGRFIFYPHRPPLPKGWQESDPSIYYRHPLKTQIGRVYLLLAPSQYPHRNRNFLPIFRQHQKRGRTYEWNFL